MKSILHYVNIFLFNYADNQERNKHIKEILIFNEEQKSCKFMF